MVGAVLVLLLLGVGAVVAEDLVPILAWSNRDAFLSVSVDETTSKVDIELLVQQSHFSKLGFVFVFRTAKLTFDDIAKYGSVYGEEDKSSALENIQAEMMNSVSSLWAGGEGAVASLLIEEIAQKLDMSPNFIAGMEDVAVIFGQPQLLVVDLPFGDCEEEFAQQDAMIYEVLEAVHHLDTSYAAFYTAMTTNGNMESLYTQLLGKRDAPSLATSSGPCAVSYGIKNSNDGSYCALLCMTNATIFYWQTKSDLESGNVPCVAEITAFDESGVSGCNTSTIGYFPSIFATIEGSCSDDEDDDVMQAEVEFTFPKGNFQQSGQRSLEAGYWQMMIIADSFNLSRYGDGKLVYPFSIPIGSSYACQTESTATTTTFSNPNRFIQLGNTTDEVIAANNEGGGPVIQFTGIHIQAHGFTYSSNGYPVFSPTYDCHGFFTLPSWMGVFSVLILLVLLYVSLVFAFSVQTVDRFEDPRAPSITIENLH